MDPKPGLSATSTVDTRDLSHNGLPSVVPSAMRSGRFGVDLLVGPNGGFRDRFWPNKPFVHHGPVSRFAELLSCPDLADARATIYAAAPPILIFGKNGYQAILPDADEAMERFEQGDCSLYLPTLHSISIVRTLAEQLSADLGVHPAWMYCEGFLAREGGAGVGLHYDFDLNFNIQLRGSKVWHIAKNTHVDNPIKTYVAGSASITPAPDFAKRPMPSVMPKTSQRILLQPGSVIFLPRGYWHETQNQGDSFALSFAIKPPTFGALVLSELGRRLELESKWREHAYVPAHPGKDPGAVDAQLSALLQELSATILGLTPSEVFSNHRSSLGPVKFGWVEGTRRRLLRKETGWVLESDRDGIRQDAELDEELAPFMAWLVSEAADVTVGTCCQACPKLSPELIEQTLLHLVSAGMLRGE